MKLSVNEIAKIIQAEIIGDPLFIINSVSSFEDSDSHDITFAYDAKYLADLQQTKAGAVIIPDTYMFDNDHCRDIILLKTNNPKVSFFKLVSIFHPEKKTKPGIHPSADIGHHVKFGKDPIIGSNVFMGDHVQIGDNVHLMPGVYLGDDVSIGDNTVVKPNVTIMEKTRIGKDVIIHSGTVIGSDGFGFVQNFDKHEKIIHTGYVHIGDHVEIGACNTIDRGTLGMTVIGNGVKTDNLVHIAHNVKIGENTLIVAQVGIAGSTKVGKNVIIAGKAGITGHIKIGDGSIVGPYAGVHSDVSENEIVSGIPHMPHGRWRKVVSIISRLPEMRKKLFSFEKRLKDIENKNE
ncbi:MAG: UDP-3-O-(3-hydroxymyristoyl)glucosamine N-acyltransferase [Desulfobacula sp.]|uniref:UDP-3-O-(3-hydroxymyristoyl)glucosamine N-acyltransferase n=1 Tax=Desulfobacula sp. TaxID=2593537 RepID=UPI0025B9015B|nr:UDP-3-O-(3-hydroxymyristoyl)glucosamine N-acyltransferase [Desulfobacula sp.]MCD4721565.1 UDP-3-O-(3-hydroxymyristoyl)glucosamine N-acyltransferase [Desulfobacula sp.]